MRTIYIDSDYICHADYIDGRTAVETDALNEVLDVALPCYRFIPAHDEKVELIQCIDSERERIIKEVREEAQAQLEDMKSALEILGVTE